MVDLYTQQLRAQARAHQNEENAARNAAAFGQMISNGQGPLEWDDAIDFGLTFAQVPFVSVGYYVDADDLRDKLELKHSDDPPFPLVTSFVTDWDRDENGLYTGAWVGCRVYFPPLLVIQEDTGSLGLYVDDGSYAVEHEVPPDLQIQVTHMFRFEGIAIKNVGNAVDI